MRNFLIDKIDSENKYGELARSEFNKIINVPATEEKDVQDFMERNPFLVPGSAGINGISGHLPHNTTLITQPKSIMINQAQV